jgi:PQQ-like domain
VTITAITTGATGNNTTVLRALTNFTWTGTGATSTTLTNPNGTGTAGQPTIVAFNQLYSSCGTTPTQQVPATFWSYNTGTAAFAETSPVLSLDGTQVAFVQRTGNAASLVLLKPSNTVSVGTVGAPTPLTSQLSAVAYRACIAPCMLVIPFSGIPTPNDTNSSPYYVYYDDILYVGADNGTLHKFTGVFTGTPAEVITAGWPVTVSAGNMLTSPVYDANGSGLIFIGSDTGASSGGQLHSIDPRTNPPTVANSAQLATYIIAATGLNTTGVGDSPIVDWAAKRVYVFVESDTNNTCGGVNCKAVFQFRTDATINNSTGLARANVGRGQIATRVLYAGAFDNTYYTSPDGTSPTGNLYVCGALPSGTDSKKPVLWRIPITGNTMGAAAVGPTLVTVANPNGIDANTADCSPITEVMNGANDYIYVSVNALGNDTGCAGACVYLYNLTGLTWNTAAVAAAGIAAPGGAGGIIIDNISATTGASQIYYSTITSPGNAIQASQAGLQ